MTALRNKIVVVTGGFGQLGMAVARAAIDAGAQVAALDRSRSLVDTTALAGVFALGDLDLAETAAAVRALERFAGRFGGLDAVVNVAGTFRWEALEHGSVDTWDL